MFPGMTTRLSFKSNSETTIDADVDMVYQAGALATIKPRTPNGKCQIVVVIANGAVKLDGGGNIFNADGSKDIPDGAVATLIYNPLTSLWYVSDALVAD